MSEDLRVDMEAAISRAVRVLNAEGWGILPVRHRGRLLREYYRRSFPLNESKFLALIEVNVLSLARDYNPRGSVMDLAIFRAVEHTIANGSVEDYDPQLAYQQAVLHHDESFAIPLPRFFALILQRLALFQVLAEQMRTDDQIDPYYWLTFDPTLRYADGGELPCQGGGELP